MRNKIRAGLVAIAGLAAFGGTVAVPAAQAKSRHRSHVRAHKARTKTHLKLVRQTSSSSSSSSSSTGNTRETALTGDTLTSASNAALAAVPGGTVTSASTEDPSDASGAAYEVKVTKADGSRVEVLEDSSFTVLSVNAVSQGGGNCHGGQGGSSGGPANEPVLTGDALTSASNAALAAVPGGTVTRASQEDPSDPSGAAYEVHVTKADGTQVEVLEDSSFTVTAVNVVAQRGPGGPRH
jgi:uncharacterized membrane protein YkoI